MTEDEKIHDITVASIVRHSMNPEEWRQTSIGHLHPLFHKEFSPQSGELVVTSAKISSESWYVFTTRRLVICYQGQRGEKKLQEVKRAEFGNFKGVGLKPNRVTGIATEVAALSFSDGSEFRFEYETGKASMAPIYATKYWQHKKQSLEKLTANDKN